MNDFIKKQTLHAEVLELLPWFVNNSLADKEQVKVMTHLGACAECQQERDRLQQLQALVQKQDPELFGADYKPSFEKLMARIEASETEKNAGDSVHYLAKKAEQISRTRNGLAGWLPYAAAASVLVGVILVFAVNGPEPTETLNVPATDLSQITAPLSGSQRLMLTFESNLDSEAMRAAFISTGAYIVSGPDAEGRYIVEIKTTEEQDHNELIRSMIEVEGVKYASLVD